MTSTGWAVVTAAVLALAAAIVAVVRVPWSAPPAPRADQVAALADLPPEVVARGRALRRAMRPTSYASLVVGLVVALGLGLTHLGAAVVSAVGRPLGGGWFAEALVGGFVVVGIGELLTLPMALRREVILRRFDLSNQTWTSWTVDLLKGYAVGGVIGAVALVGFFGAGQAAPRTWWVWVALGAAGLTVLFSFVFPVVIEPIFNRFSPMPAGEDRDALLALAAQDGVPVRDVLVADASRRTNALNAYVSGLGPTRRIVVYDTLLRDAPPAEVRSVVAHELGHAKDGDVVTATALAALGVATAICVLPLVGSWTGLLRRAGVDSIVDPRALALLLAVGGVAGLVAAPAQAYVSRLIEARADGHALELTQDPSTVEDMERRLASSNIADVDPPRLEHLMFASHPSVVQRMAAARAFARGERARGSRSAAGPGNSAGVSGRWAMSRTLLVTNDFPPRAGGIQQFVHNLAVRQAPQSLVVYCSRSPGWESFDAAQPFEVVREDTTMLLPKPVVARRAVALARDRGCDRVWFGAAAPLGLLAGPLREKAGVLRAVALTHGHEAGWAALPGARGMLRRIARGVDVLTYLGEYFRARLDRAVGELTTLDRLAPGVDADTFTPAVSGAAVRQAYGLTDRPVIVCVSRLVPRKGQDMLIRALPEVRRIVTDAALLLVGSGPHQSTLEGVAAECGVAKDVFFTGPVGWTDLPAHFAAGDVFAMPCRTRRGGLDVEGLGIVYLEASASGLPVVAGDSGGAPDAVRDGETGYVVGGRDVGAIAERVGALLADRALAERMGAAGRAWVEAEWRWDLQAARLAALLDPAGATA